jgi:hypothetical protein
MHLHPQGAVVNGNFQHFSLLARAEQPPCQTVFSPSLPRCARAFLPFLQIAASSTFGFWLANELWAILPFRFVLTSLGAIPRLPNTK